MQAPKNGFFYVIDRTNGKLISAKPFVPVNWAKEIDLKTGRPVEDPAARFMNPKQPALVMPGPYGAHNWHPMSFSPQTGLVYLPAQELAMAYLHDPKFKGRPLGFNIGIDATAVMMPDDPQIRAAALATVRGSLKAWDPVTQKERWSVEHPGAWNGGVLSTAGNLVFQGNVGGEFVAYNAADGTKLWSFPAQTGVVAAPATYAIGDEQYVVVLAGWGGTYAISGGDASRKGGPAINRSRVLAFKLGGTATLPEPPADASAREASDARRRRAARTSGTSCIPHVLLDVSRRLGSRRRRAAGPALVGDESLGASMARSRDRRREKRPRHGELRSGAERRGGGVDPRLRDQARQRFLRAGGCRQVTAGARSASLPRRVTTCLLFRRRTPTLAALLGGDRFRRGLRNPRCMPSCK